MARQFNGTHALCGTALAPQTNFSVSLWFKIDSNLTSTQYLFSVGSTVDQNCNYIAFVGGNSLWCGTYSPSQGAGNAAMSPPLALQLGVWYHVGAVWQATNLRHVYFNGIKTTDGTNLSLTNLSRTSIGSLFVDNAGSNPMFGRIAHLGIWGTQLSDAEMLVPLARGCNPKQVRSEALTEAVYCDAAGDTVIGAKGNIFADYPPVFF